MIIIITSLTSEKGYKQQKISDGLRNETGWGADYVVSMYPSPPHTIHPPHIGSTSSGNL